MSSPHLTQTKSMELWLSPVDLSLSLSLSNIYIYIYILYLYICVTTHLSQYDICPGDGLVSEVVNGLMARPDWQQVVAKVTLGHIPGGSGNGVARSILAAAGERFNINNAAFLICKGNSRKIDLAMTNVRQNTSKTTP